MVLEPRVCAPKLGSMAINFSAFFDIQAWDWFHTSQLTLQDSK